MYNNTKITSIILAGGKSTRFGTNKALEKINNIPVIEYVYHSLLSFSDEIIISSNTEEYSFLPAKLVKDKIRNIGPISGIYSSLCESKNEMNIITTCDTPLLTTDFFLYLLDKSETYQVSNPTYNNISQPIIGVFNKSILPTIESSLKNGITAPPKIIKKTKCQLIEIFPIASFFHKEMFRSINTKEDFDIICEIKKQD